jgi:uncharacterized membrane protein YccC
MVRHSGLGTALGSVASAVLWPASRWRAWRESRRRLREELEALEDQLDREAAERARAAADGQYVPWDSVKQQM